jgi:cysteine desulfurase
LSIGKICFKNQALKAKRQKDRTKMKGTESEKWIYLDHNATTPLCPEAAQAMAPYMASEFGNPSSGYFLGTRAKEGIEAARREVASILGAMADEIVFTSGGSESNNMALKGVVDFREPGKAHIITSAVDTRGRVDPDAVEKAIRPGTALVSIMLANNETGTLQPVSDISRICRHHGVPFHTDAAQAVGKISVNVDRLGVDFLTVAGHKLYGPKGVGALYMRRGRALTPLVHGAGQEMGKRAGTENVILAAGLGAAARSAEAHLDSEPNRMREMRDRLERLLFGGIEGLVLNGHPMERLPNTLNVSVPGLEGGRILDGIPRLMASTGAACHDRTVKLSHVLSAMGVPPEIGMGALRLTVGRLNTMAQMEEAAKLIVDQVAKLRGKYRRSS